MFRFKCGRGGASVSSIIISCRFQYERPFTTVPLLREHAALIKAVRLDTDPINVMVKSMKFAQDSQNKKSEMRRRALLPHWRSKIA